MHELSIAEALVASVERHAAGRRVTRVEVRVGHLRQVVPGALELAFELVARETVADGAELELEQIPAVGRCRACAARTGLEGFPLVCRACGSWDLELIQGEELELHALELDDQEHALATGGRDGHGDRAQGPGR
jgi:hydrogenase nickel incorporation protein HypA/HybF